MGINFIFFLGPPGAGKDEQARMFAKKLEGAVKVVSIGNEFIEMQLLSPDIHDSILNGRLKRNDYTIARFNEEVDEVLEKNKDITLIFAGSPKFGGELRAMLKTIRGLDRQTTKADFVFLNVDLEESRRRVVETKERGRPDDSEEPFQRRWSIFEKQKQTLIAEIIQYKRLIDVNLVEIDASGSESQTQKDITKELLGEISLASVEKGKSCGPRVEFR